MKKKTHIHESDGSIHTNNKCAVWKEFCFLVEIWLICQNQILPYVPKLLHPVLDITKAQWGFISINRRDFEAGHCTLLKTGKQQTKCYGQWGGKDMSIL
jgi:hypothetical protein